MLDCPPARGGLVSGFLDSVHPHPDKGHWMDGHSRCRVASAQAKAGAPIIESELLNRAALIPEPGLFVWMEQRSQLFKHFLVVIV